MGASVFPPPRPVRPEGQASSPQPSTQAPPAMCPPPCLEHNPTPLKTPETDRNQRLIPSSRRGLPAIVTPVPAQHRAQAMMSPWRSCGPQAWCKVVQDCHPHGDPRPAPPRDRLAPGMALSVFPGVEPRCCGRRVDAANMLETKHESRGLGGAPEPARSLQSKGPDVLFLAKF